MRGGGVGDSVRIYLGRKYTPLYEKGIKKHQNKSMETTVTTEVFGIAELICLFRLIPFISL